jgi:hypothetical protein
MRGRSREKEYSGTEARLNPIQGPTHPYPLPHKVDTSSQQSGCTTGCTSEGKHQQPDPLEALAAVLLGLSPEDRARLAALLLGQQQGE